MRSAAHRTVRVAVRQSAIKAFTASARVSGAMCSPSATSINPIAIACLPLADAGYAGRAGDRALGARSPAAMQSSRKRAASANERLQAYNPPFCCATMQNSMGTESIVLTREVMPAIFAAAAFSSGLTWTMPSAFFWFGQMMNQTL